MYNVAKQLSKNKKKLIFGVGLLISVVSLWFVFHSIPFYALWHSLKKPNYLWLIPNLIFGLLAMLQQAYRWRIIISPIQKVGIQKIIAATAIGFLTNNLLPFRLGEYARVISLSQQHRNLPTASLLATVFVERLIFDLGFLTIVSVGVIYLIPINLDVQLKTAVYISLSLIVVFIIIFLLISSKPDGFVNIILKIFYFLSPKSKQFLSISINSFLKGLTLSNNRKLISIAICQTALIWFFMALSIFFLFKSFGFELSFTASLVMIAIVSMAMFIPSIPGYIGVYHLATVLTLSAYNITGADARAFAIVLHLSQFIPTTMLGFYFLHKTHLSVKFLNKNLSQEISKT